MIRSAYSLLMLAAVPFFRRKLQRRGLAEPGYLEAAPERFGRYGAPTEPGRLWIHAVSLGETRAAAILIAALRRQQPGVRILLTHGTATGRAEGRRLLGPGDAQAWLPWDVPAAVDRFLLHFRPGLGVLMETEIWPNLVAGCGARGVPLVLANARLSEKSMRQALRIAPLSRPAYAALAAVWAQTAADAARLARVGAQVAGVLGNLKFDAVPEPALLAQGQAWRARSGRTVILLASSRDGEEAALLRLLQPPREPEPRQQPAPEARDEAGASAVQWLIVPRHPQRFDEVAALAAAAGFSVSQRSAWGAGGPAAAAQLWIGDSVGEMPAYYSLARVALLGGSFEPLGGQNLIEAAAFGCPVVMGPHTFNFAEAAQQAQAGGAALRANSMEEAVSQALALARDAQRHAEAVQAAVAFAAAHRGAAEQTARAVLGLLAPAGVRASVVMDAGARPA